MKLTGNNKTLVITASVVLLVGVLAWAFVPYYSWYGRATGFGGVTSVSDTGSGEILDQTIRIRFDASRSRDMPWDFKPAKREIEIRIGETTLAFFEISNPTDRVVAGRASSNVLPFAAGRYFIQIDCFCFGEQVLQPGETAMLPVTFYVDPQITRDDGVKNMKQITLSYTFHEIDLPEDFAALAAASAGQFN